MPLLRLLLAGLVAVMAMVAVFCTAVLVLFTGLLGWIAQIFRPRRSRPGAQRAGRRGPGPAGDVIEVEATPVPEKPRERLP